MKLVGATNGFIRFPFFVEGVTSGLISALIASAIVCGGYYAVYEWYGKNPTNLTAMFGGTLLPAAGPVVLCCAGLYAVWLCAVRHWHCNQHPQTSAGLSTRRLP